MFHWFRETLEYNFRVVLLFTKSIRHCFLKNILILFITSHIIVLWFIECFTNITAGKS